MVNVCPPLSPSPTLYTLSLRTMTLLEHLPDELLVLILSDLPNRDLASASSVCRWLYNFSQPLLYREPHLTNADQRPTSPELFLRTLLTPACKSFGTHVRCLTVGFKSTYTRFDRRDPPLTASRSRFSLADAHPIERIQVALLLHLVPRLEVLISRFNPAYQLNTFPPTLRDVTYEWPTPIHRIHIKTLLSLLRLPRIRSIAIPSTFGLRLPTNATAGDAAEPGSSSVTRLTIHSGSPAIQPLRFILAIPRALTHFVYHPTGIYDNFDFASFGLALLPLQHSLTSLDLDFRAVDPEGLSHQPPTTIGSLRGWVALRSVTCTLQLLLGGNWRGLVEVLPAGIRELEILDDLEPRYEVAVKVVMDLLAVKEVVPALERVGVYADRMESESVRMMLEMACGAVGVVLDDGGVCDMPE